MRQVDALNNMTVLVTGALGMLARELVPMLQERRAKIVCADLRQDAEAFALPLELLDITDRDQVLRSIERVKPSWIVNCAAYTAVDRAEEEPELCMKVNAAGPGYLAEAAGNVGAKMLHISSDYVFGEYSAEERQNRPFVEDEPMRPCGVYGRSKAQGDERVLELLSEGAVIARTSWLHGVYGPNFVDTMLRLGAERDSLKVVDDQIGSPTWARWLAATLVKLICKDASGVYHTCSRGNISWFDFAKEIFLQAKLSVELSSQTTAELNRPAPRPPYSTLDVTKLETLLAAECPSWQSCVREHLQARNIG
jgi:dTDP-4-dehydrorhamnose reductase